MLAVAYRLEIIQMLNVIWDKTLMLAYFTQILYVAPVILPIFNCFIQNGAGLIGHWWANLCYITMNSYRVMRYQTKKIRSTFAC